MKKIILAIFVTAVFCLCLNACKNAEKTETTTENPAAATEAEPEYKQDSELQAKKAVEEISSLAEAEKKAVQVAAEEDFVRALKTEGSSTIRLTGFTGTEVSIADGNDNKTVIINAPTAQVLCDSALKGLVIEAADGSINCTKHIDTLVLEASDVKAELSGGADYLCVTGKNITLELSSGEYPCVFIQNVTSVINNRTPDEVILIFANGSGIALAAQHSFNSIDGTISDLNS